MTVNMGSMNNHTDMIFALSIAIFKAIIVVVIIQFFWVCLCSLKLGYCQLGAGTNVSDYYFGDPLN